MSTIGYNTLISPNIITIPLVRTCCLTSPLLQLSIAADSIVQAGVLAQQHSSVHGPHYRPPGPQKATPLGGHPLVLPQQARVVQQCRQPLTTRRLHVQGVQLVRASRGYEPLVMHTLSDSSQLLHVLSHDIFCCIKTTSQFVIPSSSGPRLCDVISNALTDAFMMPSLCCP